jgi:magnesium transporter
MSHDDRVDLLRRLPPNVKESLLRLVDEVDRKDIATLFSYPQHSVGALMTTDYAWLPPGMTTAEAIDQLRQQAPDKETIYYVYVLDEPRRRPEGGLAPRKLLGVISLRDLILAPRHAVIRDLMKEEIVGLKFDDDPELAAELLARYDLIAIPVLDPDGGMLGIVTHDDVIDVIQQEATEDIQKQAAISPLGESYMAASFYRIWRSRAFWLSMLFVAELATFTVMSFFEDAISAVVVLSLFVPLCISTGGNSGSQAATLITRALALGEVRLTDWKRVLRRELFMGLALGLTLGVIAFFRGAATGSETRGGPEKVREPFTVRVPASAGVEVDEDGDFRFPERAHVTRIAEKSLMVRLPEGAAQPPVESVGGEKVVNFPANCEVRTSPVSRWELGQVIAISVLGICLWGTLVGTILPFVFKSWGADPAVASGPFVATFVDVTGIAIFFAIAKSILIGW